MPQKIVCTIIYMGLLKFKMAARERGRVRWLSHGKRVHKCTQLDLLQRPSAVQPAIDNLNLITSVES